MIGFVATVAVTVYVTKIAKKALDSQISDPESNSQLSHEDEATSSLS